MPQSKINSIVRVIKDTKKGVEIPKKKPKATVIDNFKQTIIKLIEKGLSGVRIHDEELASDGFRGSFTKL